MKIAIVTDAIYPFTMGGSEARNHEIAKRLVKIGHEVSILGAKLWDGQNQIEIEGVKVFGFIDQKKLYTKNGRRSALPLFLMSLRIYAHLLKNKYDLIDVASFNFFNCYTAKLASLIKKTSIVFTWHQYFGDYLLKYFGFAGGFLAIYLEKISLKLSKNNIAVSSFVKSELIKNGTKEKNIQVIPNGADIYFINKIPEQEKKYDLIFVGRLNYQKNIPLLVEAVKILKNNFPKIKTAIVGAGEEKENLENLIKKYELETNFEFLGEIKDRENLFKILKSAKIFTLPSILEGFPLTLVEANACGLPVVSVKTAYNNTQEYIKNNENGIIVSPNPKEFADTIHRILENQEFLSKMSKSSIKKAAKYNWDDIYKKQETYYKWTLLKLE